MKRPRPAPLTPPTNTTGADSLHARLGPIGVNLRFRDMGIGVVDFTSDVSNPKIWLHNEGLAFRTGSTGKIAILLGAVQLRDDVRRVKATGLITTPEDFNELFSVVWRQSPLARILRIARRDSWPRISTIFDVTKTPPDFIGADVPLDKARLSSSHFDWSHAPDLSFWERLWLTGARSDNIAASSCISEIG